jgi:hypothetical protein
VNARSCRFTANACEEIVERSLEFLDPVVLERGDDVVVVDAAGVQLPE